MTAPSITAPPQARLTLTETVKGVRLMWRRRSMVTGVLTMGLTDLGASFFIGGGHLVKDLVIRTLPGLLPVAIASTAAVEGSGGIAEEINSGTLEQSQLSPATVPMQVLGRVAARRDHDAEALAAALVGMTNARTPATALGAGGQTVMRRPDGILAAGTAVRALAALAIACSAAAITVSCLAILG